MNFFNVHANFWPASGKVTYYKYHPGKYLLAFLPKAAEENEHASTAIDTGHGEIFSNRLPEHSQGELYLTLRSVLRSHAESSAES